MLGTTILRDLGIALPEADQDGWRNTGDTSAGEQVWERRFDGRRSDDSFLVTVLFHPETGVTRTLYTALARDEDRIPHIPVPVRRGVETFVRALQDNGGPLR